MSRFEIVIDKDDEPFMPDRPWNAALFEIDDEGRSGDAMLVGVGATAQNSLADLLSDWMDNEHETRRLRGECVECQNQPTEGAEEGS